MLRRLCPVFVGIVVLPFILPAPVSAQGVTTGAIGGIITEAGGAPVAGATIQVSNPATGYSIATTSRDNGRYLIPGLEVGGPYTVTARRIGFEQQVRSNVYVSLSQTTPADFTLSPQAAQLTGIEITATTSEFSTSRTGVETTVGDTAISRLPTLNRNLVDLVKLSPHVAVQTGGGPSAAGAYNRLNNFTIDGANQNDRFGLGSSEGVPGGGTSGRIISIDAVKEFQILLTPADVRHGNFAGMLVNAVTKSGTNAFSGGAFYAFRNPEFAAGEDFIQNSDFEVQQYGFHLGGPIIPDRLHFFIAPEWQQRTQPAVGPYVGQPEPEAGAIDPAILTRIEETVSELFPIGGTGLVRNDNPLTNLSGRLDWQITPRHRAVFRQLYNTAEQDEFSRNSRTFNNSVGQQNSGFRFTSNAFIRENKNSSSALQVYSYIGSQGLNEFLVGYNTVRDERIVPVMAPEISVQVPNLQGSTNAVATFGTEQFSPGNLLEQEILEISNNYSQPIGAAHTLTVGGRYERTHILNNFAQRSFGVWAFNSVEDLENRTPLNYSFGYSNGGPIAADFNVAQYSVYAQDLWLVSDRFSLTYGLRVDIPHFLDTPVENTRISTAFTNAGLPAVRTNAAPKSTPLWSPRVGFNWDPTGDRRNQVRGTIGVFTGPPPLIMIGNAFANTGLGLVTLNCTGDAVPTFTAVVADLPRSCAGQDEPEPGQAGTAGVNVTDPNFKYPQSFTVSLGFDRALPYDLIFTFEGLYRRAINGVLVRDLNLRGPRMVGGEPYRDRDGRVLYADTISSSGSVTNTNQRVITSIGTPSVNFTEGVIQVTNQSRDYSYSLSPQVRRQFGASFDLRAGYTYMRSKDLQSLTSDRAISNWRNGAQYAGLETDLPLTTSAFERRHRLFASGTYTVAWRWGTDISFYYSGTSGFPITYTANGDLNGDGFNGNDPIYIPRDATDGSEIRFTSMGGTTPATAFAQAQAFEKFISEHECLDEQRGRIMEPMSCRTPWSNRIDLSIRQPIPVFGNHRLAAQLDVFNFGNWLGRRIGRPEWGQTENPVLSATFPQQQVLRVTGRTPGALSESHATFNFNANIMQSGAFQRQQTVSTNFYQAQLTLKYLF